MIKAIDSFLTVEYLICYAGFVIVFVLYLLASGKVKKLQYKCSIMLDALSRIENLRKGEESNLDSTEIEDPALKDVVEKLQYCQYLAFDTRNTINKLKH